MDCTRLVKIHRRSVTLLSLLAALLLVQEASARREEGPRPEKSVWSRLEVHADLQNLFHFRNDSDFDRSEPKYDEEGQTVGAFATLLTPAVTWHILDSLRIVYEVELGLNYWSKQNPDQQDALATDVFVLKHRQVFGEGEFFDDSMGFKVGYAHFRDPTGLFVSHWMGLAQTWVAWSKRGRLGFFLGQVPDQTYEGINIMDNNLSHDIWVFGGNTEVGLADGLHFKGGISVLHDSHLVHKTRWLISPSAHLEYRRGRLMASLDAMLQAGQFMGEGLNNEDQTVVAWAAQGRVELDLTRFHLQWNVMFLSPDDAHSANNTNHAFLYSGKSGSATLMLTEDEVRDWYDNVDERMGAFRGGFFLNRAGLFVGDMRFTWKLHDVVRPSVILGAATVLKPENALDNTLVGVETDLLVEFKVADYLVAHVVFGGLFPGSAGSALLNKIDQQATDPIVMAEISLLLRY